MKGQNFPVEMVLTFGFGLMATLGLVQGFDIVAEGVFDSAESAESQYILEDMISTIAVMEGFEGEGRKNKSYSDEIATRGYEISGDSGITVGASENHTKPLPFVTLTGKGSGEIAVVKSGSAYEVSTPAP